MPDTLRPDQPDSLSGSPGMVRGVRLGMLLAVVLAGRAGAADRIDFNRDVRPILSESCFACHGPDEKHRKAKLRLDTKDGAARVLTPGKPDTSELFLRLNGDESTIMPPKKSG